MPLTTFQDGGGDSIQYMDVDGVLFPYLAGIDQENAIRKSHDATAREDDIILINYLKSGSHWMWEVLSMLVQGKAETIPKIKELHFIEFLPELEMEKIPSPRVLNTHYRYGELPKDSLEKKVKLVVIHRNPKDVMASMYNHHLNMLNVYNYHGKWDNWLKLFYDGKADNNSWFDYTLDWERAVREHPDHPIHVMFFEDMKEDSRREVKKLAAFLGLNATDDLCNAVADKCEFHNMKQDKKGLEPEKFVKLWRDNKPGFYRKGEVGDWKNWFTVSQNEEFEKIYAERMTDSKIKFRFEL